MKPYYQDDLCTIYNGDCRDVLEEIEVVDTVLVDPPGPMDVDRSPINPSDTFDLLSGFLAGSTGPVIWICNPIQALEAIRGFSVVPERMLAWVQSGTARWASCGIGYIWNPIFLWCVGQVHNGPGTDVLRHPSPQFSRHPGQKPIALIKDLLCLSPGGTVLDPFMGSGSTLIAARELGRRAIGIETEERYCEVAISRIQETTKQNA